VGVILWQIVTSAETSPLAPPEVPLNLPELPPLVRLYACQRLFLLDVEYALSPGGQLRGLAKLACRISFAAAIIALCLAAVLACVSLVLGILVIITGQLVVILWNLVQAVLLFIALLAIGAALLVVVRLLAH